MASTYTPALGVELIATGEQSGLWGQTVNQNYLNVFEAAITATGTLQFTADANQTFNVPQNSAVVSAIRAPAIIFTSAGALTATRTATLASASGAGISRLIYVYNNTTGSQSIVVKTTSGGVGVTVPNGKRVLLKSDGTDVVEPLQYFVSPLGFGDAVNTRINLGALANSITATKTASYAFTAVDCGKIVPVDSSAAAWTQTLTAAATVGAGFVIGFQKIDATYKPVTLDGNGAETINGRTTIQLNHPYEIVWLMCDGSNWQILSGRESGRMKLIDKQTASGASAVEFELGISSAQYQRYRLAYGGVQHSVLGRQHSPSDGREHRRRGDLRRRQRLQGKPAKRL
jgi:hypothetical protein